ncbi:MAG: TIGR01212 family radical SAM protein [Acidobacteriota bacterium]
MPGLPSRRQGSQANMDAQSPGPTVLYNRYGRFLKDRFGEKVYKVSVDGGLNCPNLDGTLSTEGCTYCNNKSFRPQTADKTKSAYEQALDGMEYLKQRYGARKFIVYFQPSTNTHAPLDVLAPLYESAIDHRDVVGLSVGTRPDCIDEEKISWFETLARTRFVTLEYGLQSVYDSTLKQINRGHDYKCWTHAIEQTRNRGIYIGTHLILGFPWENRKEILDTADVLSDKGIHFLKLHHLHVVKDSTLEKEYREKPFHLLALDEYVELVVDFLEKLNPFMIIERLHGTAPMQQLIGPLWDTGRYGIRQAIETRMKERGTWQGKLYKNVEGLRSKV